VAEGMVLDSTDRRLREKAEPGSARLRSQLLLNISSVFLKYLIYIGIKTNLPLKKSSSPT
jgi:hypothetical protein